MFRGRLHSILKLFGLGSQISLRSNLHLTIDQLCGLRQVLYLPEPVSSFVKQEEWYLPHRAVVRIEQDSIKHLVRERGMQW